jgi:hypothetical protein
MPVHKAGCGNRRDGLPAGPVSDVDRSDFGIRVRDGCIDRIVRLL